MFTRPFMFFCDCPGCFRFAITHRYGKLPDDFRWLKKGGELAHACSEACEGIMVAQGARRPSKYDLDFAVKQKDQQKERKEG